MTERKTGRVKWFNQHAGYGFITVEDDKDVFVTLHDSEHDTLEEGEQVSFEVAEIRGTLQAVALERDISD